MNGDTVKEYETLDTMTLEERKNFVRLKGRTKTTLDQPNFDNNPSDNIIKNENPLSLQRSQTNVLSQDQTSMHKKTQSTLIGNGNPLNPLGGDNGSTKVLGRSSLTSLSQKQPQKKDERYRIHSGEIQAVKKEGTPILFVNGKKKEAKPEKKSGFTSIFSKVFGSKDPKPLEPVPEDPIRSVNAIATIRNSDLPGHRHSNTVVFTNQNDKEDSPRHSPEHFSNKLPFEMPKRVVRFKTKNGEGGNINQDEFEPLGHRKLRSEIPTSYINQDPLSQFDDMVKTPIKGSVIIHETDSIVSKSTGQDLISPETYKAFSEPVETGIFSGGSPFENGTPFSNHSRQPSTVMIVDDPCEWNDQEAENHVEEDNTDELFMKTQQYLLNEFKQLKEEKLYKQGIYVSPSSDDPLTLYGLVLVKGGYFENGKFRFEIKVSKEYPTEKLRIYFKSKVYHALVNAETGELDMKYLKNTNTQLLDSLRFVKNIFNESKYLEKLDSFHEAAGERYTNNGLLFKMMAKECVKASIKNQLFEENNNPSFEGQVKNLTEISSNLSKSKETLEEKVKMLLENITRKQQ